MHTCQGTLLNETRLFSNKYIFLSCLIQITCGAYICKKINRRNKNEPKARLLFRSEKTTLGKEFDVTAIKSQIREI